MMCSADRAKGTSQRFFCVVKERPDDQNDEDKRDWKLPRIAL
jgi:hypothetical protein